jgi:hypothetical protein
MHSNDKDNLPKKPSSNGTDFLRSLGGEPLEGSGFENEISESDSEWEDPQ